jgi:RNA polymerase sigma factor (sigma-70 family)
VKEIKYTEENLVTLLKNKDLIAYNSLYDNYSSAIYGIISRIVPSEKIAQDLLQDVFIKIWKGIGGYDREKGRLFTWMLNIARNTAIDYTRSRQSIMDHKIQTLENSVYELNKQSYQLINTDVIGVKEQVVKLKEDYRILIELVYFKGFTQEETAKELNLPLGTVKTRIRAAIMELRQTLK